MLKPRFRQGVLLFLVSLCVALPAPAADWIYTVVDGDNLWDFSTRHLDSTLRYEQLRRINNIAQPRRMRPGTRIRVPMQWIRSNPTKAQIIAINGDVELQRSDGTTVKQPGPGTQIGLGDRLLTGADSSAAVGFADESRITLHQRSQLSFDHLSAYGTTGMVDSRVRLLDGRLETDVTPSVGPGSRFEIHTPSAISAVRGTAYRAAVSETRALSSFEVTGGRVGVSAASRTRLVRQGFGTQVELNKAPQRPRELLAAPLIEPPPTAIRQVNWNLRWQPVDGAARYRVEIASNADFTVLAWDREPTRASVSLPDLPDGVFHARVRAIDAQGLEGHDSQVTLTMDTRPRPPVPLKPGAGEVLRGKAAKLQWSASADATRYRVEIASDPGFDDIITRTDPLASTDLEAAAITQPGTYHWRVYSIAGDGEIGPPSDARSWTVKPVPERVAAALSTDDDRLTASWRAAADDARYQVQLAYDPEFNDLQFDELTGQASFGFDPLPGQVRYLRVRVVESDGYLGPWGVVQRIDPPPDPTAWIVPVIGILGLLLL